MNTFLGISALAGIAAGLAGLDKGAVPALRIKTKRQAGVLLSGSLLLGLVSITGAAPATTTVPAVVASRAASSAPQAAPPPSTVVVTVTATWTPSVTPTLTPIPSPISEAPSASVAPAAPLPVVVVPPAAKSTTTTSQPEDTTSSAPVSTVKVYANCTALNGDYPHGVARSGGVDLVKGERRSPQPKYKVDDAVYDANTERDGDGDGVACEKV